MSLNLDPTDSFARRHIGPRGEEIEKMLSSVGRSSLDDLCEHAIPQAIRYQGDLSEACGEALSESQALAHLKAMIGNNKVLTSYIGMGYYGTQTPPVILRNVLENPGWYTQYTPYQAEISQGRLEALLNFQTMVAELTGLPVANASLLDEGTAAAEAMSLALRAAKKRKGRRFFVDANCHPQTIACVQTRALPIDIDVEVGSPADFIFDDTVFGVLLAYPGSDGAIGNPGPVINAAHASGALAILVCDLLAQVLLKSAGSLGADVAVGTTQRFGVPLGFGGPHAAFMACSEIHKRRIPGRIIGISKDIEGRLALRMALQTREQHIRRDRATSNICTAQVLLAIIAGMYAVYHGPDGLKRIARRVSNLAQTLAAGLKALGFDLEHETFFDTLTVRAKGRCAELHEAARSMGYNLRDFGPGDDRIAIALDETCTAEDLSKLLQVFGGSGELPEAEEADFGQLNRSNAVLEHEIFTKHHSETEMLRYLHRLQAKDLSLTGSMIPLGSCTMKLNATAQMLPVTWSEFGAMHPFVPADQSQGYRMMFADIEAMLAEITGLPGVSLQPNAGSQGEYAGMLVIKAYHNGRGEGHRNICLIPASAHGTNPASAVMAGLKVALVACDGRGNVDLADLRVQAEKHSDNLAAIMVTYPSTHGVFETGIVELCEIVHEHGGQVYLDGANMNAQVGLARPGDYGADVMHLNLHKTFAIPHGGGGPGIGPIAVGAHLSPYLPGHPLEAQISSETSIGAISAAPWGSAGVLPISWMYLRLLGADGLKRSSQIAILSANYLAYALKDDYDLLYTGERGYVAHEFILDIRPIKKSCGVDVVDVAKRLMDYGFHSPTMSFPVAGTLMVEPTESEPKVELDRLVEALKLIRAEIAAVEAGEFSAETSVLRNAPHSAQVICGDWGRAYSRELAAFPTAHTRQSKFWPSVSRIDEAYGDRNLICTCPPLSAYGEALDEA